MENKRKIVSSRVIALAVVAVMLVAIPPALADIPPSKTYPANATWFDPEIVDSTYCTEKNVDIWINTSVNAATFRGILDYTYCCANVTKFECNTTNWDQSCLANLFALPGHSVIITGVNSSTAGAPAGLIHIGTLTIHCCNETYDCLTNLTWDTGQSYIEDKGESDIPATWHNGTINCTIIPEPDLNVSSITINPGDTRAEGIVRAYIKESNNISALVWNNGTADAGAFDVCFDADGVKIGCEAVAGLAAGANTTVSIDWTPTCANYSVMPGFPAQSLPITINVTADCNCTDCPTCPDDGSNGKIAESDETNNILSKVIPAIQVYSGYDVIGGVVNNGYKSKSFDCNTTEEPLYQFEYDDMYGGIAYNVSGVKISTFSPGDTSTRVHHIDIPDGRTVKKARLYVYWYDKWDNYKTYPSGCLANLSVTMDSTEFMPDAKYNDAKGFGYYQNPKGTYAYNVTSKVAGSGDYTAVVKNIDPNNGTTLLGEMLYVVYEDPTGNNKIQLWTLEGNDYLMAADDTHNTYDYSVSPEEATATVAFSGAIDLANVTSATLISVVAQGMAPGSNMLFNGSIIKTDAWNEPTEAYLGSKINIESIDVNSNLLPSGNNMGFQDNGTNGMQASNAMLIVKFGEPDLNVSSISVNPGDTRAEGIVRAYIKESNNISALVWNNGTADAGAFDVCFDADGVKIGCEAVAGLAAGANTTVSIDWTPTCANYSVMPGFPAQSLPITINVTADCNCTDCPTCPDDGSNGKIAESDETNNILSKVIPAIQVYSGYDVIGGVVNNGYKSKSFDCNTTEEPLYQFEYDDMYGGIAYNVSGVKISTFSPGDTSTRVHHIDIPDGRTVKKARLYVYWYDKWDNYKTYPSGCLANLSVTMDSTEFMPDAKYNDAKGFGYYQNPKGTYAYNVTSKVAGSGDYTAVVKNIDPNNGTTLLGEMLYVVYEDPTGNNKIQLWTLEGNDYLMAADDTHNTYDYSVSPEEATATVAFSGAIDLANVTSATLISVVAQGMAPGSNMLFNGSIIKTDAWNEPTEAYLGSKINIESIDVNSNLLPSGNNMGFQDNGTNGMQASNAILMVEYDTTPPTVTITSPVEGATFTTATITVKGTATDNVVVTSVTVNRVPVTTITPGLTVPFSKSLTLAEGANTITVVAADGAGNTGSDKVNVTYSPPPRRRGGGGGGAAPRDSDGDGYDDITEMLAGTDPKDPNDYPGALTVTPTPTPTPTPAPVVTPTAPPAAAAPTPTPTPTPEEPGFEAVFAIAGLLAVAYLVLRRRRNT